MNQREALSRFGTVVCYFCGKPFDQRGTWLLEPHEGVHPAGSVFRARCRIACTGVPFMVRITEER